LSFDGALRCTGNENFPSICRWLSQTFGRRSFKAGILRIKRRSSALTSGRRYDHNFRRFLPIFGDFCRFSAIFANFRRKKQYYSQFKKRAAV
jgi:hypothetical protein